jgi:hypothetical protein
MSMSFRDQLLATLRAVRPVLRVPGVMVVGSELPNLIQPDAASTLVVSRDVDLAVPVAVHAEVKACLPLIQGLRPAPEEPSVWRPESPGLIEVNFIGRDDALADPEESYVLEDRELPLLVFGALSLAGSGRQAQIEDLELLLPNPCGLLLEKLLTERSSEKGERDLLVALGLLLQLAATDLPELDGLYRRLRPALRHSIRTNLALLSLIPGRAGMPDPKPARARVVELLRRLEALEETP